MLFADREPCFWFYGTIFQRNRQVGFREKLWDISLRCQRNRRLVMGATGEIARTCSQFENNAVEWTHVIEGGLPE